MTEKTIYIAPYTRTDGTQVRGHYRRINTDGVMTFVGEYGGFDPNENPIPDFWFDPSKLPEKKGVFFPDEGTETQDGMPTGWEPPIFDDDNPTDGTPTGDTPTPDTGGTPQGGKTGGETPQGGSQSDPQGGGNPQDSGKGGGDVGGILAMILDLVISAEKLYFQYKIAQTKSEAEAAKHLKPYLVQHVQKLQETNIQLQKLEQKKIEQLTDSKLSKAEYKKMYTEIAELHKQNAKNTEFMNKLSYHIKNDNTDEGIEVLNDYIRTQKPSQMPENKAKIAFAPSDVTTHYTPPKQQIPTGIITSTAPRPFPQLSIPTLQDSLSLNVTAHAMPPKPSYPQNAPAQPKDLPYSPISFLPDIYARAGLYNPIIEKPNKPFIQLIIEFNQKYSLFINLLNWYNWTRNKYRHETALLMELALKNDLLAQLFKYNPNYIVIPTEYNNIIEVYYGIYIPQNFIGIIYDKTSSLSQKLSNDSQLQCQVFLTYLKDKFLSGKVNLDLTKNPDLHYSIGHATILQSRIDHDGYYRGILYDIYDFEKLPVDDINWKFQITNNLAYFLQEIGYIKNYYMLIPIEFKWNPSIFTDKYIKEHNTVK